nr:putative quinol monooxygenase [Pseudomonas syringae]
MTVIARITVYPDHIVTVRNALLAAVAASNAEEGCEQYQLFNEDKTTHFVIIERWSNEAALVAHTKAPAFSQLSSILTGRAELEILKLTALS